MQQGCIKLGEIARKGRAGSLPAAECQPSFTHRQAGGQRTATPYLAMSLMQPLAFNILAFKIVSDNCPSEPMSFVISLCGRICP